MCVWLYNVKLSLPVYIVFIVHIAIYIVGDYSYYELMLLLCL